MNTQFSAVGSLTNAKAKRSLARSRLNDAAQLARHQQLGTDDWFNGAAFERFLYWLGPDPESAGRKYESIRARLIMMFKARRCVFPEDLADVTFERVVRKLTEFTTEFTGDPARYFYGVAKKIYLEYQRELTAAHWRTEPLPATNTDSDDQDLENMLKQLDQALSMIPPSDRELVLKYYTGSGRNKINDRRALAQQCGIGPNALRLRVFRIRQQIKSYMQQLDANAHRVQT